MIKEQILILKVKYDDEQEKAPHTWSWGDIVGEDHEAEVINHGQPETVQEK